MAAQDPNVYVPQTGGQQGFMGYTGESPYGVMPPPTQGLQSAAALNGQGGYVGAPIGGFMQGVQGGYNFAQQMKGQHRADEQYNQNQEQQRAQERVALTKIVSARPLDPTDPEYANNQQTRQQATARLAQLNQPQGQGGFYQALSHAVQKIKGVLPGHAAAVPGAPQGAPGVQQQPTPAPAAPAADGSQQPAPAMSSGGVMPDFMTSPAMGAGSVVPASTEGQQPPTRAPTQSGYVGFEQGGPIPTASPAPAAAPPPQGAAPQGQPPPMIAAPQEAPPGAVLPPNYQDPSGPFNQYYQGLLKASLNDKGDAPGREPVPSGTSNPNVAIQSAANNPAATQGVPEDSPQESGKAVHSLSSGWYEQQDALAMQAAASAARAGHDPQAVYAAMSNMTTSFLQTHIMREASAAAVAVQSGDQKAVEKALKNMYYYIPDGQELQTSKVGGVLTYQNPIYPYLDKDGNPTDQQGPGAKPNMVPVDLQHISMLAQAAANPAEIGGIIQNARIANMKAQTERVNAEGARMRGAGILAEGQARLGEVSSTNYKNLSGADLDRARAAHLGWLDQQLRLRAGKNMDPGLLQYGEAASRQLSNDQQGEETTTPTSEPVIDSKTGRPQVGADGKPIMQPSLSPAAGKSVHDPNASVWSKASPEERIAGRALAADIAMSNAGQFSPQRAAQIATLVHVGMRQQHPDPKSGKPTPNVHMDRAHGMGWAWDPQMKQYVKFQIGQNTASTYTQGGGAAPTPEELMTEQDAMTGTSQGPLGAPPVDAGEEPAPSATG